MSKTTSPSTPTLDDEVVVPPKPDKGQAFGQEGTNKTQPLPEPSLDDSNPGVKYTEKTPYTRG